MDNLGQKEEVWTNLWNGLTPEAEIKKWDFYGLRPWIVKYASRHGKVVEAGCGLGRWVFYLSQFGIAVEGLDFSKDTIAFLNAWQKKHDLSSKFQIGDVKALPYEDNSLSGYLSFGVVEHFIEGPQIPLKEAYRVLAPGGVAIVTTPSVSWYIPFLKFRSSLKRTVKRLLGRKVKKPPFFQYEYRPKKLARYVQESGLHVTRKGGSDILYTFYQLGKNKGNNIYKGSFAHRMSSRLEKGPFRSLGAQSIVIAVKVAEEMHCFLCGELTAKKDSLDTYEVPVCSSCASKKESVYYKKNAKTQYHEDYEFNADIIEPTSEQCDFCGEDYLTSFIFEKYGFNKNVCSKCLRLPEVNIELSNSNVKPVWRNRKKL